MTGGMGLSALGSRLSAPAHAESREPTAGSRDALRLRAVARDLEGVFVEQLFKAMRETVPEGGVMDGGSGEEMFTGLLDQRLAAQAPARWEHGLAEALYRQLRGAAGLGAEAPAASPPAATSTAAPPPSGGGDAPGRSSPGTDGPILGAR